MRKNWKGKEIILLREDEPGGFGTGGGFTSIDVDSLTAKMEDLFSEESLTELATEMGLPLAAVKNMTFIAVIKINAAGSDSMGWKKHKQVLKDDGFDV